MAYVSTSPVLSTSVFDRVASVVTSIRQSQSDYRLFKATINELEALETRELTDLGIYRGDIRAIAHKSVYGN